MDCVIAQDGAVALSISAQLLFLCKKITARPRKNPAVGVKLSYATNKIITKRLYEKFRRIST